MNDRDTDQLRSFIQTELDLGFTFMKTAALANHPEGEAHLKQALGNARAAYQPALKFRANLPAGDVARLKPRLDQLGAIVFG